jgi:hypothetical protein
MDLVQRELFNMKIALVCIAKNEDNYIQEWIDYHKKLGYDDIFIYQNNWRCQIEEPNVIKIEYDGEVRQVPAYNDFIQKNKTNYDWVSFFDVDEFLVLKKHKNIKEFIQDYQDFDGIGVNWILFGDNNLTGVTDEYSVIKRFTKRQLGVNEHIKSTIKLTNDVIMGVHAPNNKMLCNTNKELFSGSFNRNTLDDIAQINHYFCKTREEFIEKINRGRSDTYQKRNIDEFDAHNINEIEDVTALKFIHNDNGNLFNT